MEGEKSKAPDQNCQAVSEVYGTVLLIIITIILASSLIYPNIPKSAPIANLLIEVRNFQDVTAGGDLPEASSGSGSNTSSGSGSNTSLGSE
ncbi:archaellin/type IV pilin N-terminal domain-containing protein, partial [Methanosarcina sp. UBA5]|uniref:archaellin/type IV pilin N-terminal domain-containing protein n=1 Tax=Methanosarcina sp. UBA5 TaxID=1915593 RepID=UPI0025E36299